MSFKQLAELRDRLRAEKENLKTDIKKPHKLMPFRQASSREQDPAVEAILRLQKHFPLAFQLKQKDLVLKQPLSKAGHTMTTKSVFNEG